MAKQAQRERDRTAGLVLCQIKVTPQTAEKLRRGLAVPGFEAPLAEFLDGALVDVEAYPNLKLLCWNRAERYLPAPRSTRATAASSIKRALCPTNVS